MAGVPTPIRVKYSPLPCASPETTWLEKPRDREALRGDAATGGDVSVKTRAASRSSRSLKICSGVEFSG